MQKDDNFSPWERTWNKFWNSMRTNPKKTICMVASLILIFVLFEIGKDMIDSYFTKTSETQNQNTIATPQQTVPEATTTPCEYPKDMPVGIYIGNSTNITETNNVVEGASIINCNVSSSTIKNNREILSH